MIKGVNKQVLEINESDNGFFEKAIFFVKPEYSGYSEGRLRLDAQKRLKNAGLPPKQQCGKSIVSSHKIAFLTTAIAGIIVGMTIAFCIR